MKNTLALGFPSPKTTWVRVSASLHLVQGRTSVFGASRLSTGSFTVSGTQGFPEPAEARVRGPFGLRDEGDRYRQVRTLAVHRVAQESEALVAFHQKLQPRLRVTMLSTCFRSTAGAVS